jgi:hypothetical protein
MSTHNRTDEKGVCGCRSIAVTAVLLAVACIAVGCNRPPRAQTVDLAAGRLAQPPGDIGDRKSHSADWPGGISMPFEKTGTCRLGWDEEALYGAVGKYEHRTFDWPSEDRIYVGVGAGRKWAWLHFGADYTRPSNRRGVFQRDFALLEAFVCDDVIDGAARPLPSDGIEAHAFLDPAQQGFSWYLTFRLPWKTLGITSPEKERAIVAVHRLVPTRVTHEAVMNQP